MHDTPTRKCLDLRRAILEKEYKGLNDSQRRAVFHVNGPLLILAGAGSGKTTVLIRRIANIIRHGDAYESSELPFADTAEGVQQLERLISSPEAGKTGLLAVRPAKPWQIMAITFTNKAAGELKDRLSALLGDEGRDVWASTFHSACARILRRDGERIGYTSHFAVYDTDDSRRLMRDCQRALNIEERFLPVKSILSEISRAKDRLLSPGEYSRNAGNDFRLCKIAEAYEMYERRLREGNAMDFDGLLFNAVRLLESCPDVLEYYQNRFHYVLVDEYQDTNRAQFRLIQLLAGKWQNLCVVGDDDQSIYKFRGATIENILDFERQYPDALVIRLEQNYRSTQNILDAANHVIANNSERKGKTLWTDNGAGEKLSLHTADNEQDEAGVIVDTIIEQINHGRSYSDFAILYRMNAQSNTIEKNLIKSGIPYRIIGGHRFYERKEIRDMIAYLSVINNPNDEVRLRRIINEPKRTIGDKTVNTASEIAAEQGVSLYEVLAHADEYDRLKRSAQKLMSFVDMLSELMSFNETHEGALHELYERLLHATSYIASLDPNDNDTQTRIENINELASNLLRFEQEHEDATLSAFLEEVSLLTDIDNYNADASAVVLMTMHSAKGLEFPVVFLPGLEEGIFPAYSAIMNPAEIEEERRLAYVALTRAKQKLYLLNANTRMLYGATNRNKLSRFVGEIPEELLERTRTRQWKKLEDTRAPEGATVTRAATTQSAYTIGAGNSGSDNASPVCYSVGERVLHKAFGEGTVLKSSPMGNDVLLEIAFDSVGAKKLMSNFARLKKI